MAPRQRVNPQDWIQPSHAKLFRLFLQWQTDEVVVHV